MKAVVNQETCIGCTLCVQDCPEVFKMQDDKAIVYVDEVPKEVEETCRKAADDCPVSAIELQE